MWTLATFGLILLCGADSFRVRQRATASLDLLDNVPVRAVDQFLRPVYLHTSVLDEGCVAWGKNHRDPEIRGRMARLR